MVGLHNSNFLQQLFMYPKVTVTCFPPVEDGDALDPCILSTLRKLQDGYFAGARSVSVPQRLITTAQHSCSGAVLIVPTVNDSAGCRRQTSPASRPLRSTHASASWTKRTMKTYLRKRRMTTSMMKSIAPTSPQVAKQRNKKKKNVVFFAVA